MKIRLGEGRRLRDPITKAHLRPDEVRDVALTMFWHRRLRDGDVVPAEAEQEPVEQRGPVEDEHQRRRVHHSETETA